jgi:hypothetical protein
MKYLLLTLNTLPETRAPPQVSLFGRFQDSLMILRRNKPSGIINDPYTPAALLNRTYCVMGLKNDLSMPWPYSHKSNG